MTQSVQRFESKQTSLHARILPNLIIYTTHTPKISISPIFTNMNADFIPHHVNIQAEHDQVLEEIRDWLLLQEDFQSPSPLLEEEIENVRPDLIPTPPLSRNSDRSEEEQPEHPNIDLNNQAYVDFLELEIQNILNLYRLYPPPLHIFNPRLNAFSHLLTMRTNSWPVGFVLLSIQYGDALHIITREPDYFTRFLSEIIFDRNQISIINNHLINAIIYQIRSLRHSNYFFFVTRQQTTVFYNSAELVEFIRNVEE